MRPRTAGREVGLLLAQTTVSWLVQVPLIYTVLVAGSDGRDADGGFFGYFVIIFIGPILLNGFGLVVGLPFRLSDARWAWLSRHGELPLAVAAAGVGLTLAGSTLASFPYIAIGLPVVAIGLTNAFLPFGRLWDAVRRRRTHRVP